MRKVIKLCLAVAMIGALNGNVMAEDTTEASITGRAIGWYSNYNHKTDKDAKGDRESITDSEFKYNGRIGAHLSTKTGGFTVGGYAETEIDDSSTESQDVFAYIENEKFLVEIGRLERAGITMGGDYIHDYSEVSQYTIGEEAGYVGLRRNSIHGVLKDLGVSLAYSIEIKDDVSGTDKSNVEFSDGKMTESYFFVKYEGEFGPLGVSAQYSGSSTEIDKDDSKQAQLEDSKYDGGRQNSVSVAAQYKINDKFSVAFNLDQISTKEGSDGDTLTDVIMLGAVDFAVDENSGVSVTYGQLKDEYKDGDDVTYNNLVAGYTYTIGAGNIFAQYAAEKGDSDDDSEEKDNREITFGMAYNF